MAYRDFSLEQAIAKFQLKETYVSLFPKLEPIPPGNSLAFFLKSGQAIALPGGSEKARSEFLIAPILVELENHYNDRLAIYSGTNLDIARDQGLTGECDFILGQGPGGITVRSPLMTMVEGKRDNVETGIGQCVAQMVGSQRFNQANSEEVNIIFGCVTTGEIWQFLSLEGTALTIDRDRFYINQVDRILACFYHCLDQKLG